MSGKLEELKTCVFDKRGIPIERGDVVKVFHFQEAGKRGKRHYMYKQCLGVNTYPTGHAEYVFFTHLNFADLIGERNGPYHERLGAILTHYEIVQSIKCDHESRAKIALSAQGRGEP